MNRNDKQIETIIYGGTFNPPTLAHEAILQACIDISSERDGEVWLLPSGERTDKCIGVDREQRIAYLRAMIASVATKNVNVSIQTEELDRTVPTETYDTVMDLNNHFPERRFTWVFGSDSVETMPSWQNGELLLDTLPMLIVERDGYPVRALGRYASKLDVAAIHTSSTEVRNRIAGGQPIDDLVSRIVLSQLRDNDGRPLLRI